MLHKILILLAVAMLMASCVTSQYSEIGIPGVRQVDQYDDDQPIGTSHQKFCPEAKGWFDAEPDGNGEWQFTAKGQRDRQRAIDSQAAGGGGDGGGGGGGGSGGGGK